MSSAVPPVLVFPALALLGLAGCGEEPAADADHDLPPPRLVVLISLDTVRADRLGVYGYGRDNTPHLGALARDGVRFETVGAQAGHTLVSHKSLFAGKYPVRLLRETTGEGMAALAAHPEPHQHLQDVFRDLAAEPLVERFRNAGYATVAFTDDLWMSREMGFQEGFDFFDPMGGRLEAILPRATRWLDGWLERGAPEPLLLFLHAYDAHCPYPSRDPFDELYCDDHERHLDLRGKCAKPAFLNVELSEDDFDAIEDHYDSGIASADAYVGGFLAELRARGLYDESLIAVFSDHGESLGEASRLGHGGLHPELLLVPLIVKFPGSWGLAGRVVEEPVELVDVLPTLADACDVALPDDLDGRSLMPLARGEAEGRDVLVAQIGVREGSAGVTSLAKRAVLDPGEQLVIENLADGSVEVFDLAEDGHAPTTERDAVVEELLDELAERDRADAPDEVRIPDEVLLDEDFERRLEALGYVGGQD